MLITSEQGKIEAASPHSMIERVDVKKFTVADRPYFIHTMNEQELFVSSVFLGRGFGSDPIVTISAPIYTGQQKDKPSSIVEGSLNLGKFSLYDAEYYDKENTKVIVTDQNNSIIYASKSLGFSILSELKYDTDAAQKTANLISLRTGDSAGELVYL